MFNAGQVLSVISFIRLARQAVTAALMSEWLAFPRLRAADMKAAIAD
jgi:hypothetical protein